MALSAILSLRSFFLGVAVAATSLLLVYWVHESQVQVDYTGVVASQTHDIVSLLNEYDTDSAAQLTEGEAVLLRARLIAHAAAIADIVAIAETGALSPWEEMQLVHSLSALQTILNDRAEVLALIDTQAQIDFEHDQAWQSVLFYLDQTVVALQAHVVSQ
ncbi:MAG: hypothetical protein AAGA35_02200 [Patescibacteria group bacterium]